MHTVHAAPPALCWQTARALPPPFFPRDRNAPSSERDGLRRSLMGLLGIMGCSWEFMGFHGSYRIIPIYLYDPTSMVI